MTDGGKLTVGFLHNIGLGHNGYPVFAVVLCIFKGSPGNPPGSGIGGDLKVHGKAGQLHAPAAQDVLPFRVLPVENPVDSLLRDGHRADIGIQVQLPAKGHIGAFHGAAHGGGGGALQQYVTGLDLLQHLPGDRLSQGQAVFDGEAFNLLAHHASLGNLLFQELMKHLGSLLHDNGANAVSVNQADGDHGLGGKIGLFLIHVGNSLHLLLQKLGKFLAGQFHFFHTSPSLVAFSKPPAIKIFCCLEESWQATGKVLPVASSTTVISPVSIPLAIPVSFSFAPWERAS